MIIYSNHLMITLYQHIIKNASADFAENSFETVESLIFRDYHERRNACVFNAFFPSIAAHAGDCLVKMLIFSMTGSAALRKKPNSRPRKACWLAV